MKRWFVLLALMVGCHSKPWTTTNVALASTATASLVVDWAQTEQVVVYCTETNPVLGECGQRVPTYVYFPVSTVLILAAAHFVPPVWRNVLLGTVTGVQTANAYRSASLGYGF